MLCVRLCLTYSEKMLYNLEPGRPSYAEVICGEENNFIRAQLC